MGKSDADKASTKCLPDAQSDFASAAQTNLPANTDDDMVMKRQTHKLAAFLDFLRHRYVG